MAHSESIQEHSGSKIVKENTETDNLVEKNDCDGESLQGRYMGSLYFDHFK